MSKNWLSGFQKYAVTGALMVSLVSLNFGALAAHADEATTTEQAPATDTTVTDTTNNDGSTTDSGTPDETATDTDSGTSGDTVTDTSSSTDETVSDTGSDDTASSSDEDGGTDSDTGSDDAGTTAPGLFRTFSLFAPLSVTTYYVDTANGSDANDGSASDSAHAFQSLEKAVSVAQDGDVIDMTGTESVSSTITVSKAVTIDGQNSTTLNVSGTSYALLLTGGATVENLAINKTDNATQNVIGVQSDDVTISGNTFTGTFNIGNSEVTRAIEVSGVNNVTISGNHITHFRQPAYINKASGTVSDNYVADTKGWVVVSDSNITFTDNSWGTGADRNAEDIAIIADSPAGADNYAGQTAAISAANNNAVVEDQVATGGAELSTVYVDASATAGGNGTPSAPYQTMIEGVRRVAAGGTIYVAPGDYNLVPDSTDTVEGQTGWYLPLTKDGVTLQGVDSTGAAITDASNVQANIYSTNDTPNGNWSTQDLILVDADNVSVKGLGIMNKISPNKGIEVLGDNFTAEDDLFAPIPTSLFPDAANYTDSTDNSTGNDLTKYGSGVYFNNNGASAHRTGTVTDNLFQDSGVTFDSFGSNWDVTVSGNTFDGNKVWTADGTPYYYSAVGATTWANQPDFSGSSIAINENQFVNMAGDQAVLKIKDGMTGTFDATKNYWGASTGPTAAMVYEGTDGTITASPWLCTSDVNGDTSDENNCVATPTANTVTVTPSATQGWSASSAAGGSATIVADSSHTGSGALELITGTSTDSVTHYTLATDVAMNEVSKLTYDTKVVSAADAVNGNATLRLNVNLDGTGTTTDDQLMFEPYYNGFSGSTDWNTWTITQSSGNLWSNNDLTYNGKGGVSAGSYASNFTLADVLHDHPNAKIVGVVVSMGTWNVSQDVLVDDVRVKTYSSDTTYDFEQDAPANTSSDDNHHSFHGSSVPGFTGTVGGSVGGGQVLGAATYNFTADLTIGSTGADVTALQQILIDAGFLHIAAPTGYFGPLTQAALAQWQAAHGITPAVGYFGPITMAAMNAGTIETLTEAEKANILLQLQDILAQIKKIQDALNKLTADAS